MNKIDMPGEKKIARVLYASQSDMLKDFTGLKITQEIITELDRVWLSILGFRMDKDMYEDGSTYYLRLLRPELEEHFEEVIVSGAVTGIFIDEEGAILKYTPRYMDGMHGHFINGEHDRLDPDDLNNLFNTRKYFSSIGRKLYIPYPDIELVSSEKGEVILEYRPFSVKFKKSYTIAKDLFTGDEYEGKMNPHPELSGYTNALSSIHDKNIPSTIALIEQHPSLGWQLDELPKVENVLIREIREQIDDGEIWYVPIFEIPVITAYEYFFYTLATAHLKAEKIKHWDQSSFLRIHGEFCVEGLKRRYVLKCSIPVYISGAVFRDGFFGNPLVSDEFVTGTFFDRNDHSIRILTLNVNLNQELKGIISPIESFRYDGKKERMMAETAANSFLLDLKQESAKRPILPNDFSFKINPAQKYQDELNIPFPRGFQWE